MKRMKSNLGMDKTPFDVVFRHAFFVCLCIISLVYYKERTLHFDPAFFNWLLILNEEFFFALGRNGAVLGQMLPLLFLKMGGSIKITLMVFSVSFALWYYLFFLVTEYVTKDKVASWVLVLSLCLTFRQTFYYTTAEVYHGMALAIVLWSLLRWTYELVSTKKYVVYIIILAGTIWLPFFHQINLLLWLFLLGVEYLSRNKVRDPKLLSLLLLAAVWFVLRIKFFSLSDYEKGKLITLDDHLYALDNFFELPSYLYLREWAELELFIPMLFFGCCILFGFFRSKFLATAYIVSAFTGFVVLIVNTNFKGESMIMYENYYSLFGLFIAASWALANRGMRINAAMSAILIGITVYSTIEIVQSVWLYKHRTAYLARLTNYATQSPDDKFIVNAKNYPFDYATVPWAFAFETALYSVIDQKPDASTFYMTAQPEKWGTPDDIPEFLSAPWAETWFGLGHVQSKGFDFTDRPYRLANTSRMDTLSQSDFDDLRSSLSVTPDYTPFTIVHPIHITNVHILNESGQTLHSLPEGPHQTRIGYQIFQNEVVVAEHLMPLEVDIHEGETFVSGVVVIKPVDVSKGTIKFGLYTESFGWWGVSSPIPVEIDGD